MCYVLNIRREFYLLVSACLLKRVVNEELSHSNLHHKIQPKRKHTYKEATTSLLVRYATFFTLLLFLLPIAYFLSMVTRAFCSLVHSSEVNIAVFILPGRLSYSS